MAFLGAEKFLEIYITLLQKVADRETGRVRQELSSASVLFHSSCSRCRPTPFGLPQGSVLYILFTADIGPLLASCSLASHSYADDVQAYKHCLAYQAHSAIRIVSHATDTLNEWMSSNRLLLNPQKSQYIWFGTRQQLDKLDLAALSL